MAEMLLAENRAGILTLTLNRPDKRNALHPQLIGELGDALQHAAASADSNVVVLTGAGSVFCAGLDLQYVLGLPVEQRVLELDKLFAVFHRIYSLPQPVIAAINGPAVAGGFDLAAFCDLRVCADTARFRQAEVDLGLTPLIWPIYKTIGLARARELAMTCDTIDAQEALRIGLVNHVYTPVDLMPRAMAMAAKMAAKPREALFATKHLSRDLIEMPNAGQAIDRMYGAIRERLRSAEHQVALDRLLKKDEGGRMK
ncbi:MAG: enoyl-CoA hydratase/isomerase family protein [Blastocatellia bacterium]